MSVRRAVFLDRDGVLNEPIIRDGVAHSPASLDELVVTPGAQEACRALRRAGLILVMVTNQPDLARGTATRETVDAINEELRRRLGPGAVFMCPHDGADAEGIAQLARNPDIKGFTTNPTLMRAAGVTDYEQFARGVLPCVGGLPISFEVFADDFDEMERQARKIATWGDPVYVKIPI